MFSYNKVVNSNKLKSELSDLAPSNIETVAPDTLNIYFDYELSSEQVDTLNSIVTAHNADLEVVILKDVTPRQIRQALVLSGITTEQIETALDSLPEPTRTLARIEWEYSVAFQRSRPLVATVGQMLGQTPEQLDALWILAGSL